MIINWARARIVSTAVVPVAVTAILWPVIPGGIAFTRVTQVGVEPVTQTGAVRVTQVGVEAVPTFLPTTRVTQFGVEVVLQERSLRVTQFGVEVIQRPIPDSCEMQIPGGDGGAICTDDMSLPADSGGGTGEP